jgi:N-acetylglucosaminyldiphosphoundecaprenol N-acetyl-beta-D-mannosaminyltransferase
MVTQKVLPIPNDAIDRLADAVTASHPFSGHDAYDSLPERSRMRFSTFNVLGFRIQAITLRDLLLIISEAVLNKAKYVVTNHNMHSLYVWYYDAQMRDLYARADFTHVDGLPLIPLFRLFGARLKREHRIAHMELLPLLATEAIKQGWRIYYLGSKPGIVEKGAERLREQYPGLQLRTHHGYFDTHGAENDAVLRDIRDYAPDVLMVGMGMPRQEAWINENLNHIVARTVFCSGCTMDYVAGKVSSCPRWLGNIGFEWCYRLLSEPTRLWSRYLVEPWFVLGQLGRAYFKLGRSFESSSPILEDGHE